MFCSFGGIYPPRLLSVANADRSETLRMQTQGDPDHRTISDSSPTNAAVAAPDGDLRRGRISDRLKEARHKYIRQNLTSDQMNVVTIRHEKSVAIYLRQIGTERNFLLAFARSWKTV